MSVKTIDVQELREKMLRGEKVELLDVRTPAEFQEIHVPGANLVPLDRLDPKTFMAGRNGSTEPLYILCRSGNRARKACEKFLAAGFDNVVCVEGGTLAWEKAGFPVNRGRKVISLERQVRIAAGLLVVVSSLLGFFVHPYFIAIAAFVGAGLIFAGITDTCGMAMILARMPWNQAGGCETPGKSAKSSTGSADKGEANKETPCMTSA
ncbi:MAG: rhodanese-like domain-containing protein [Gemmatales bacterium]|nr:rhodanese-like domain-containing protein [Gemmatales bacterium]MDW8388356.1 rhodanese-like domain-containing protein [Gemmatales bacterium]